MATHSPRPISAAQMQLRQARIAGIAAFLGFGGNVEYRHVYSQTGGAQYGRGSTEKDDVLTVYAEAFERDQNPDDFSLEAIIAHERGHQILARHRVTLYAKAAGELLDRGQTGEQATRQLQTLWDVLMRLL